MNFNPMKNETDKERDKRIERKIVARLSRGNLSLQQGRYITSEDIERIRKKNREWKFDEK
jgi:hypothetical protein